MSASGASDDGAVAKQAVAAGNLANIDTPGFRTREATLATCSTASLQKPMTVTTDGQLPGLGEDGPESAEVQGLESRRDGNNVQLDRELLTMTKASADFAAAQAALSAKFRLIRFALNGGQ
jgi:flagellar basal-body rod protein FlgB